MSQSAERMAVYNAYSGKEWHDRVNQMSDSQIVAIYMRLKLQGRIK